MIDLGEAEPIDRLIADFRAGITGDGRGPPDRDMADATAEPRPRSATPARPCGRPCSTRWSPPSAAARGCCWPPTAT